VRKGTCSAEELASILKLSDRQIRRLEGQGIVERSFRAGYKDEVRRVAKELNEEILDLAVLPDAPISGKKTKTTIHICAEDFRNILKDVLLHFWAISLKQRQ
jgi:hypothetical protein